MAKVTKVQSVTLIVIAIIVITLSILTTLYLNGIMIGTTDVESESAGYKNVTLTDAQLECESHARRQLGRRLKSLSVDDHSTRFDDLEGRYKIFLNVQLFDGEDRKGLATDYFAFCYSRGDRATVAHFRMLEAKDALPTAVRKKEKGGAFGWH